MIEIGVFHEMKVLRSVSVGLFLANEAGEEVLLPGKYAPEGAKKDDVLKVFVYKDSHNREVATTLEPKVLLNQFGWLECKQLTSVGAFLNWGLEKDLMVPFREQKNRMEVGESYLVYVYRDESTNRLVATSKIGRYLDNENLTVKEGDEVEVLIGQRLEVGFRVIVNHKHRGMIYYNEVFRNVRTGDMLKGWVKKIRAENKLDISLVPLGAKGLEPQAQRLFNALRVAGGFLELTDKSAPEDIKATVGMSKKAFKRAVGNLLKQGKLRIGAHGIMLSTLPEPEETEEND